MNLLESKDPPGQQDIPVVNCSAERRIGPAKLSGQVPGASFWLDSSINQAEQCLGNAATPGPQAFAFQRDCGLSLGNECFRI